MKGVKEVSNAIYQIIKDEIKDDWTVLEKIRYIYLRVGSFLEKNTDFFLNDKLADLKLNDSLISGIYKDDIIYERNLDNNIQYKIICKSSATILKEIYKRFNIDSEMVVTTGNEDEIRHWFLVAKDGDKQYFLSLAADLPYIKNSLPTSHFANSLIYVEDSTIKENGIIRKKINTNEYVALIKDNSCLLIHKNDYPFFNVKGEYQLVKLDDNFLNNFNGKIEVIKRNFVFPDNLDKKKTIKNIGSFEVEYDEISFVDLNKTPEILKEIDTKIGYETIYELPTDSSTYKNMYYVLKEEESEIYKIIRRCLKIDIGESKNIDDIKETDVIIMEKELNQYLAYFLNQFYKTNIFNEYNYLEQFFKKFGYDFNNDNDVVSSLKKIKKDKKLKKDTIEYELISSIQCIIVAIKRFKDVTRLKKEVDDLYFEINEMINNYKSSNIVSKEIEKIIYEKQYKLFEIEKTYDEAKKNLSYSELNHVLNDASFFFLNNDIDEIATISDGYKGFVSQKYIYQKFMLMMPYLLECNTNKQSDYKTPFSKQGYSEQVVIIKDLLKQIFVEIKPSNCSKLPNYDDRYSAIENRIRIYPIKDKNNGEYVIGFRFWAAEDEDEITMVYIPSKNLLTELNAITDRKKYVVASSSNLTNEIDDLENEMIEERYR